MKIAILLSSYANSSADTKAFDLPYDPRPWLSDHDCSLFAIGKNEIESLIPQLRQDAYDVVINLCDGAFDEDRAGIEVVNALMKEGIPFTGADRNFYEPSRVAMKEACAEAGILTPRAYTLSRLEDLQIKALPFPLIVKHPNSYNSVGLTKASVVYDCAALEKQAGEMIDRFGGAMVEEYIPGREFTVLVCGDAKGKVQAFPPVEFLFPEGETFKHFNLKWKEFEKMRTAEVGDSSLTRALEEISVKHFKALKGRGYARTDLRMNVKGEIYLLEINPNCSVFYPPASAGSADEILLKVENGHRKFLDEIIAVALKQAR